MTKISDTFKSFIFTGKKETCSGCGACTKVCARQALTMTPDNEGFLFPILDTNKCIQCGLCDSRCPEVRDQSNKDNEQHCYIATTDRKEYYKESASIGICTMLSEYVVNQGGIVYGAYLDESNWTIYHIGVSDMEGVQKIRNSKYMQSNPKNTFVEVKDNLKEGRLVLYIGTPCQIAGLKAFLNKEYDSLYTIDLICHGVMSPKLLSLEVAYWEKLFGCKIKNFRFRSKRVYTKSNPGMVNFDILQRGKVAHIERYAASSPSYCCYAYSPDGESYNIRLSCYNCFLKSRHRYADITVGDPWGIKGDSIRKPELKTGIIRSLVLANTNKGEFLFEIICGKINKEEICCESAFVQDALLFTNRDKPVQRDAFYKKLGTREYGQLVEDLLHVSLQRSHVEFVFRYYIDNFKHLIRKFI